MREALLDVLRPVLVARGVIEVGEGPVAPAEAAALLEEAAVALERVRSMPGLPALDDGGGS